VYKGLTARGGRDVRFGVLQGKVSKPGPGRAEREVNDRDDADKARGAEVRVETGTWKVEKVGERVEVEAG
jgi:hypothetical protein